MSFLSFGRGRESNTSRALVRQRPTRPVAARGKGSRSRQLTHESLEHRLLLSIDTDPGPQVVVVDDPLLSTLYDSSWAPQISAVPAGGGAAASAPFSLTDTFKLHSLPSATKTIYLDFDGHTTTSYVWIQFNNYEDIVTPAYSFEGDSSFSEAELERIQTIWEGVSEDFLPFNVDVTTEDPGVEALKNTDAEDQRWGIRVVIGENTWYDPVGGVAAVGSFDWGYDFPCFVFDTSEKAVCETSSHEVGHTLGLRHDGRVASPNFQFSMEYYPGHGPWSDPTNWGPIMGLGLGEVSQWSQGEYPYADNQEDDLAIITGSEGFGNGFGYRPE